MLSYIDAFLNKITMYRLVLYYLIGLLAVAVVFSLSGVIHSNALLLLFSSVIILGSCWVANTVFAFVFRSQTNTESVYITALILILIITPPRHWVEPAFFSLAIWASVWSMAAKYIFAIKKKHVFNPAAFAVALTALAVNQSATWWVGTAPMAVFVVIGGLLIVRKIRRFDLVLSFLIASAAVIGLGAILKGGSLFFLWERTSIDTALFFFAFVMLTEPLTTPSTRATRIAYGVVTGLLFAPSLHIGSLYSTPELALLAGNFFSYCIGAKEKLVLRLKDRIQLTPDTCDFIFVGDKPFHFKPGQYLEWTLGHNHVDSRGNRRYFTIASSPTENEVRMGVKFYNVPSSFKQTLLSMEPGAEIVAGQIAGDFVLPKDKEQKIACIAGGIGITPFRSMVKYLLDMHEQRSMVIFYSNKREGDIVYRDVFDAAQSQLGIKTVYTLTEVEAVADTWTGGRGPITAEMIAAEIPDYRDRIFYISGPHAMVEAFKKTLHDMGIQRNRIRCDFFPGFA